MDMAKMIVIDVRGGIPGGAATEIIPGLRLTLLIEGVPLLEWIFYKIN